jgi:mannitol/fructose-specific phosphotransferase system IIA component (Ntr-type)
MRLKFNDVFVKEAIRPDLAATDRNGAIRELVTSLAAGGALPESAINAVLDAVIKREKERTTGIGNGVAIPHAKHPKIEKMCGAIGLSVAGINFYSLDGRPVHAIFLLLSPPPIPGMSLHAAPGLNLAQAMANDKFRQALRQCNTREAIADLLDEVDHPRTW